ncbi:MAG TPA: Rho termination factor N-terminal domain-containing protein [Acidimicrobiia bacterium]|nr:Rho termination factor N-terminal domain-containing protein [Acidimicrobiia bacterium]
MTDLSKQELYEQAREQGIEGRSTMSKEELAAAVVDKKAKEPPPQFPTGKWLHDHMLSIVLLGLFLLTWVGHLYFQYQHEVSEALQHGQTAPEFFSKEFWDSFLASMFENWQSEFLQLMSFVILATYFIHRGSPQSRDGSDEMAQDIDAITEGVSAIRKKLEA